MNWPLVVQVLGILAGAAVSLYQIRHLLPASRTQLKADLEILKLLDPNDKAFPRVKAHVDRAIARAYPAANIGTQKKHKPIDWGLLVFFVLIATGLIIWTVYLLRHGFNPWALLTGIFALVALLGIVGALAPDEEKKSRTKT